MMEFLGSTRSRTPLFAQRVLAVVSLSGKHLPRSLGFGPTNGPEDFSRFGFRTFRRKLFKTWFLFIDDVLVATGRGQSLEEAVPVRTSLPKRSMPLAAERV